MVKNKVLVTGIMGQTSKYLINELEDDGWEIVGTDIKPQNPAVFNGAYVRADLTEPGRLRLLKEHGPYGAIIHTAATVSLTSRLHYSVNVLGTKNLFDILLEDGCLSEDAKLINTSSAIIYKGYRLKKDLFGRKRKIKCPIPKTGAIEGQQPIGFMDGIFGPYTESKLWQELLGHEYGGASPESLLKMLSDSEDYNKYNSYITGNKKNGLSVVTVRPGLIYSPESIELSGDLMNVAALGLGRLLSCLLPSYDIGFVSAKNVAKAEAFLLKQDNDKVVGEAFNIADDSPISFAKFFELVGKALDKPYAETIPDEVKIRELVKYSDLLSGPLMEFGVRVMMGGLRLPRFFSLDDALCHHTFSTEKLRGMGWKPETNVTEEIGNVARTMYDSGKIGGENGSVRFYDLLGKFFEWFVCYKYIDNADLAYKNRPDRKKKLLKYYLGQL